MIRRVGAILIIFASPLAAPPAIAAPAPQDQKPAEERQEKPPEEQEEKPAEEQEEPPPAPLPDLDELLGLEEEEEAESEEEAQPAPPTDQERELQRRLSAQEAEDAFEEAVRQMGEVAETLRVARDAGVRTQRVQEDILKKLDMLIEQAEQNQSQSQSQQSQSQPRPQQRQQQRQQQQGQQSQSSNTQGDNRQEMLPPGGQEAPLRDLLDAAQAAWGSLPPRVRDVLLQGSSDRFSSMYESLTEEYYRRLAEEGETP